MKYSIYILLLVLPSLLHAQLTVVELETTYRALNDGRAMNDNPDRPYDIRYHGVVGTQYAHDSWLAGVFYLNSGQTRIHELANYDEVEESPVIIGDAGDPIFIAPMLIDSFSLRGNEVARNFFQFIHPKKKRTTYIFCEPVVSGRVTLMIYRRKYFIPADNSNPTYNVQQYAEFKYQKDQYFLRFGDSHVLVPVKKGNGGLIKQLGDHEEEMKAFMKENLLFARYKEDLKQIMVYYNSLN